MALLKILHFPNPRLRNIGKPITEFDNALQQLIEDMFETMYDANGVGLAATQVGIDKSLAVIDISQERNQPMVIVNPEILWTKDPYYELDEGCLSVPGHYDRIKRAKKVKIKAQDRYGNSFEQEAEDLLAECFQHEIDHLHGKLYIDYLSTLKQKMIRNKLEKLARHGRL